MKNDNRRKEKGSADRSKIAAEFSEVSVMSSEERAETSIDFSTSVEMTGIAFDMYDSKFTAKKMSLIA